MTKAFLKYHIKDRWTLWQQTKQLKERTQAPILVFTMAKVGSSSVYHSLKKQTNIPCFHIHSLSVEEELQAIKICKEKGVYPGSRSPVPLLNEQLLSKEREFKVISLFRNPIERNLSAFFEAFEVHMGVPAHRFKGTLQDIEEAFYKKLDHSYCKDWFDNHFKSSLGIDVYEHAFAKAKAHKRLQHKQADILLLKSALDDTIKSKHIETFCGTENFAIENYNVTENKDSATLYTAFKSYIRFPKNYLESQLESKYMNHFFTEKEKKALYARWQAK